MNSTFKCIKWLFNLFLTTWTMSGREYKSYTRRPNRGIPTKPRNFAPKHLTVLKSQNINKSKNIIPINLKPSGILTEYLDSSSNTDHISEKHTHQSKYFPPEDALIPTKLTCPFYLFSSNSKSDTPHEIKILNSKSYFIFGRDKNLSDIILDYDYDVDVVSKEHAVLQFRKNIKTGKIGLYLMDLDSTNGTFLNSIEIPRNRYVELKTGDKFTLGSTKYVTEFTVFEDSKNT